MTRLRIIGLLIMLLLAGRMAAQVPVLDSVCSGAVRHYGVDGQAGSTYSWILTPPVGPEVTLPSDADTLEMAWNYAPGIYILRAIQHAENGCDADAVYGQVEVFGQPEVDAGPDDLVCVGRYYKLMNSSADSTSSLLWTTGGDGTFDDPTILHATYTPGAGDITAGIVTLTLTGNGVLAEGGCEPSVDNIVLHIVLFIVPEFEPIGPLCQFNNPPALPDTSLQGMTGTWDPPVINTDILGTFDYTFHPDNPAECGVDTTIQIIITDTIVPQFDPIGPLCIHLPPPALPDTSLQGISGFWIPDTINTDVPGIFNFKFIPDDSTQCGVETSIDIAVVREITPGFDPIGPYCQYSTPPPLPAADTNGMTGTWNPLLIDTSVPGTFDYTFTPDPGQCGTDTIIQITIIEQRDPLFDSIGPYCQYSSAPPLPDTSLNGMSGTWNPAWVNTTTPGIYPFTFTPDPDECGTVYSTNIIIIQEIYPNFDTIGPLCQYSVPPPLPDTCLEGVPGTWDPPVISTDEVGSFFFDFTPDTAYECVLSRSIRIDVISVRTPSFDIVSQICQYTVPPALPDTSLEGITGTWSPDTINTSIAGTFTFTFIADTGQCAIDSVEIEIEITDEIIPEFDQIGPYCQYIPAPALPDTSGNNITGTWDPPIINTDVTGTFSFTFTPDTTFLCALDTTIQITIAAEIVPEFDTIPPICQNTVPPVLPVESVNNIQGTWNPPTIDTSVPGTFTYTFTPDAIEECAVQVSKEIAIVTEIIPLFDTIPTLCLNEVPPDLPTTSNNNITGVWNPMIIDTSVPGTFEYTFTPDDPNQCGVEVKIPITVVTSITPEFDSIAPICQNSVTPVLPTTDNQNITGTWAPSVINTTVPGTVTYTFTPDDGQCASVYTMDITINALPDVFAGIDQFIPLGAITTIGDATASGNGPLTYSWIPASLIVNPSVLNPTTVSLTTTTVFTLTVTDANGCESSDSVTISVGGEVLEAVTIPGDHCLDDAVIVPIMVDKFFGVAKFQLKLSYYVDNLQCEGFDHVHPQLSGLHGTVDQINGIITLNWEGSAPVTFAGPEKACDLMFTPKQPGLGQLDWYVGQTESYFTDLAGSSIPAEFFAGELLITDPPEIMLAPSKTVCVGDSITIKSAAIGVYPPLTYKWTYPDGHSQTADPVFSFVTEADAGDYVLLVTDSLGCADQKSIRLIVSPNPVAAFHDSDTLTVPPGYILDAGGGLAFYQWNTGEMTESITIDTTGWYWVDMTSNVGCMGTDSVYIIVSEDILYDCLWIPNAFTPDADGLNDTFKPVTRCPLSFYRMFIYNRWGEKLFESADISIGWDGTKNGTPLPGDVYVYKIVYRAVGVPETEFETVKAGTVLILK